MACSQPRRGGGGMRSLLIYRSSAWGIETSLHTHTHTQGGWQEILQAKLHVCCQDVTNYRNCSRQRRSETIRLCLQSKDSSASHIIPSIARKRKKKNNRAHMQKPHTYCIWSCESLLMQYMFSLAMQSTWTLHEKTHTIDVPCWTNGFPPHSSWAATH